MGVRPPRIGRRALTVFGITAALGVAVAITMPERWTNLESSPPYIAWLIAPAFLAFLALCLATFTDFVSNDGANPHWLDALWIASVALVTGAYGVLIFTATNWLKRIRGGTR